MEVGEGAELRGAKERRGRQARAKHTEVMEEGIPARDGEAAAQGMEGRHGDQHGRRRTMDCGDGAERERERERGGRRKKRID